MARDPLPIETKYVSSPYSTYLTLTPPRPVKTSFSDPITVPAELVENKSFLFGLKTENLVAANLRPDGSKKNHCINVYFKQ